MRRILADREVPIIPMPINAMYAPNTPTPRRCYEFGTMLGRAIKSWKSDKKVAICGSGGMSHFICDEEWDARLMKEVGLTPPAATSAKFSVMKKEFDPSKPEQYIKSFAIKRV